MKNKNGFTLIELLAVIIILAIIALIATPIILNMVENAKKGAAKDSAYGYIEAIEYNNSMSDLELNSKYTKLIGENLDVNRLDVNVKGSKPTNGYVTIDVSGRVKSADLCINDYTVTYDGKIATIGSKCDESKKKEEVTKDNTILYRAKTLVYENETCKTDGTTYEYMGGCYIKGASSSNYIWYNGFMWRIMGINSDNTVRLITDENVTSISYGTTNTAESYATNVDYIHNWLNTYFLGHLNSTKSIIKEGNYFCSETIGTVLTDDIVRTTCSSGKEVKASVGLISYDEFYLSGLSSSYLNIGQAFWTITPNNISRTWYISYSGNPDNNSVATTNGVRPVINVDATSIITEGNGTSASYYVLVEDKTINKKGTISSLVTSGEYVSLEGKTYRVVSKDNNGVKLILDEYYTDASGNVVTTSFGSNSTFTTESGIGATLNNDVLIWLGLSGSNKIKDAIWNQGTTMSSGYTYKTPLTETDGTGITANVGLIRVGEMLSGQSSTMLTSNYTKASSSINVKDYSTMNNNSTSKAWYVSSGGSAENSGVAKARGIRPVIVVRNDLPIIGGTGTWNNQYQT